MTEQAEPARCGHVQARSPEISWVCIAPSHTERTRVDGGGHTIRLAGHYFVRVVDTPAETL